MVWHAGARVTFFFLVQVTLRISSFVSRKGLVNPVRNYITLRSRSNRVLRMMSDVEAWLDFSSAVEYRFFDHFPVDGIFGTDEKKNLINSYIEGSSLTTTLLLEIDSKVVDITERIVGAVIEINSVVGQNKALSLVGSVEWIVLRCTGSWQMIPVENLIAACDGTGTKLAVFVTSAENLPGVLFSLELGPHAIILSPDIKLWESYAALKLSSKIKRIPKTAQESSVQTEQSDKNVDRLDHATVTAISSSGIGDRVCIDLIQMLKEGEGLMIGSSSKLLALVHGETFEGEYVPSRPFRVNAGPVHSYVLLADGSTKYLCEVKAGDSVKVVDATATANNGNVLTGRAITVGRCKIESRPMLMISYKLLSSYLTAESNNDVIEKSTFGQIFVQQAETVRLICPISIATTDGIGLDGNSSCVVRHRAVAVTDMQVGELVYVLESKFGTHVGNRISAKVFEK